VIGFTCDAQVWTWCARICRQTCARSRCRRPGSGACWIARPRARPGARRRLCACVSACRVDRAALGLPVVVSDSAAAAEDRRLLRALCSPSCQDGCPNIADLYATLSAGEGMSLTALCDDAQRISGSGYHRMMPEMSPLGAPAAALVVAAAAPM
jgi:hypothetical protein